MKNKTNTNLLIKSLSILTALSLTAESTQAGLGDPVGIIQVTVPASTTSVMGTPYARKVEAFGTVTSYVASGAKTVFTVVKDPASASLPSFTNADQNVDAWYIIEIVDGPAIGLILNAVGGSGNTSIEVEGLIPSSINIETGSKFAVRKAWTLSSLFGAASASNVFGSGLTSTSAGVNALRSPPTASNIEASRSVTALTAAEPDRLELTRDTPCTRVDSSPSWLAGFGGAPRSNASR